MGKVFDIGQKLEAIWWSNGQNGWRVGQRGCISIEVVMESGQMAGVPWALVSFDNGVQKKLNLALMEEVELSK